MFATLIHMYPSPLCWCCFVSPYLARECPWVVLVRLHEARYAQYWALYCTLFLVFSCNKESICHTRPCRVVTHVLPLSMGCNCVDLGVFQANFTLIM